MRKIVILIVLLLPLIVVGVLIYGWINSNNPEVIITDEGFKPDYIRIGVGTTLSWVNNGKHPHWPSSDIHPTHNKYPSKERGCIGSIFDACTGMARGEKYSFTFRRVGTWGVHDHLSPGLTMKVEVVEDTFLSNIPFTNLFTEEKFAHLPSIEIFLEFDYDDQLKIIKEASSENPREAWDYIEKVIERENGVISSDILWIDSVHVFSHVIGGELYKKYGVRGSTFCDSTFSYGCEHGVFEKMLLESGLGSLSEVEQECDSYNKPGCAHGAGHALFALENFDTHQAIAHCNIFKSSFASRDCREGIFMEYVWSAPKAQLLRDNPLKFCDSFSPEDRLVCTRYQPQIFMRAYNWDLNQAMGGCLDIKDATLRKECVNGVSLIAAHMTKGNADKILEYCASIEDKKLEDLCIFFAAAEIAHQKYYDWRATVFLLCNRITESAREDLFGPSCDIAYTI